MNLNKLVLDSSAILAVVNAEPGYEKLTDELLAGAVASTVNLAEVQAKLVSRGWPPALAWRDANGPINEVISFEPEHARLAETCGLALSIPAFRLEIARAWLWP